MAPKAPRKGAAGRLERYFILADCHHDEAGTNNDARLWGATLRLLSDAKPDGVLLAGDFVEGSCGSAHVPDAFKASYASDARGGKRRLGEVRAAIGPKAYLGWACGNHETAALRALLRNNAAFAEGFWERWRADFGLNLYDVEFLDETKVWKRGNLRIIHGHQVPGRLLPKHHAAKVADLYGGPNLVLGFGHSHREGLYVRPSHEGNCVTVALPCMRTLDPSWTLGAPMGWGQGLGEALVYPDGHADLRVIRWASGRMEYGGRVYR